MDNKNNPKPSSNKKVVKNTTDAKAKKSRIPKLTAKQWGMVGGGLFLLLIIYSLFAPRLGTVYYGVCKVLVEMNEPFPEQIKITQVDEYLPNVRIYYSSIGTFGEMRSNQIDCTFKIDKDNNLLLELEKVNLNGKRTYDIEKPEYLEKFNKGVAAIMENRPDLALPAVDLQNIKAYWEAGRRE